MSLTWSREDRPTWDDTKQRIIGAAPEGALELDFSPGQDLPGDWFVASDGEQAVGYGWLDSTWGGDTEILLAVDPERQQGGVGSFVLANIEREAARRGTNYVYNTVRDTHPDRDAVHDWLLVRGYQGNENDASLRKRVSDIDEAPAPVREQSTASSGGLPDGRPPGHEESGGYVNLEDHRY